MVQFIDKNPRDFKNHMMTQHNAFFNMEFSLACSVIDEKESKNVVRKYIDLKLNDNIKKSRIRETPNLLTDVDSSTAAKKLFYHPPSLCRLF